MLVVAGVVVVLAIDCAVDNVDFCGAEVVFDPVVGCGFVGVIASALVDKPVCMWFNIFLFNTSHLLPLYELTVLPLMNTKNGNDVTPAASDILGKLSTSHFINKQLRCEAAASLSGFDTALQTLHQPAEN